MKADRRYQHNGEAVNWKVMTTWQMVQHLGAQGEAKQPSNLLIPLTLPVEFTRPSTTRWGEATTIDPYVLGVLLGDGCLRGSEVSFASVDDEIIREVGARTGLDLRQNGISFALLGAQELIAGLKRYGLWHHLAHDKFIPEAYKYSPIAVRRLILQGLMDTDGTVDSGGWCSFCSTSKRLAGDIQWIARSLGYKATITDKQGRYRDDAGEIVECRLAHNVYIQGPGTVELFKLGRKRVRCKDEFNGGVSEPARRIVSIEPEGRGEAQCITVDHPNSLYITDDFIVTHNSWLQRLWLARLAVEESRPGVLKYPTYKGAILRYNAIDLRDWHKEAELLYCAKLGAKPAGNPREYKFPGGPLIRSGHLQDGAYVHYVGWEIHKLGLDEATHLPTVTNRETGVPESPDYMLLNNGSVRLSPDGLPQSFLTGNPGFKGDRWVKHRFIKVFKNGEMIPPRTPFRDPISGSMRIFINATVFDNPWILQNDPGYVRSLMELSPTKQKAWIYGDWDAYEGQFFDFDPVKHVIEPEQAAAAIPPHVYRWLSCDWGYSHPCAVHGFAQGLDGRVHVFRELGFEGKTGSFEVGMQIAKAFLTEIECLPDNALTLYLSHDAFHKEDAGDRRVDTMRAGIQTVLGPNSCFILEMNEDEKTEAMKDPDAAVRHMNVRRAQSTRGYGITICRADKNSVDGWDYMRELLRTEQVVIQGAPDAAIVQR
ncbi:MAG: hypothetical protein M3O20_13490, partial [Acidobacteriota bacterium]|nr:hypothetical protein [Acidobacteriota bacterium]